MSGATRAIPGGDLSQAREKWKCLDPVLYDLARLHTPDPIVTSEEAPFTRLARSIIGQQVSLAAASTIWGRLEDACAGIVDPGSIQAVGHAGLRACGLSTQKANYVGDLSERVAGGLDLAGLADLDDEAVIVELTKVKGIGVWTAKMHLIFHLAREDIVPHEDLGVQIAASRFYDVPREDAAAFVARQATRWSPHSSLAARVLWKARGADNIDR